VSALVEVQNASKVYQLGKTNVAALRGVSLTINEGDSLAIMGPSGSGKSTLMNLIGCMDRPTQGDVLVSGSSTAKARDLQLAKLRGATIGFVFQSFNLIPRISALANVMLPMTFSDRVPKYRHAARAKQILEQVGLAERMTHMPNELSGGERQRVSIARALANDPPLILADEPTGNLDTKTGKDILKLFQDLNRENRTLVVVTHDPSVAEHMAATVHLVDGQISNGGPS